MQLLAKLSFKRALAINTGSFAGKNSFTGSVHSDSIFSGIANQWAKISSELTIKDLLERFKSDNPPFRLSSAFPYSGLKYYLPTPKGTSEIFLETLKDVSYLELSSFLKLASGETEHLKQFLQQSYATEFTASFTSPRVTIDRLTHATNIYDLAGCTFAKGSGLYFLIELNDEGLRDTLELCIRLLGESGIGSDRSVGLGVCDIEVIRISEDSKWAELFLKRDQGSVSYCTLSLCCPVNNMEAREALSYDLFSRSGWIISSSSLVQTRRRECKMFSEGSLFKCPVKGHVVDVTPSNFKDHNVYRYGLALMVAGAW